MKIHSKPEKMQQYCTQNNKTQIYLEQAKDFSKHLCYSVP